MRDAAIMPRPDYKAVKLLSDAGDARPLTSVAALGKAPAQRAAATPLYSF
jgi:hypothetical protein